MRSRVLANILVAVGLSHTLRGQGPGVTTCPARITGDIRVHFVGSAYRATDSRPQGSFRTGQAADLMLSGFGFNQSGGPSMFRYNSGIASGDGRLLLADRGNNRVLIWNTIPERDTPPDVVLGQPDFESNESGSARHQLNWPMSVTTDGRRVVIADTYNDRLLIWNTFPAASGTPADREIRIQWPWGVWTDGERLVASATTGDRSVLVWNRFPSADDQPPDLTLRAGGMMGTPRTITSDGRTLIVGDHNARVTRLGQGNFVWRAFPAADDAPYDYFLSDPLDEASAWLQGEFLADGRLALLGRTLHLWNSTPDSADRKPDLSIDGFAFRGGDGSDIAIAGDRMFVSAANGNSVLVYDSTPVRREQAPDWALGSPDICTNTLETNFLITNPVPSTDGKSLFVTSDFDRKLYVWRALPDEDGAHPDLVYTLPDAPWQNALWQGRLIVAGKRTVYLWNELPLDGQLPAVTLRDGIGSVRFQELRGVAFDGRHLYLSDMQAGRVYVWEGLPSPGAEPVATLEVERPTRLSSDGKWLVVASTENQAMRVFRVDELSTNAVPQAIGGPGRFNLPEHGLVSDGRLFIADTVFNRVHYWNRIEDAIAGRNADAVLGSSDRRPATQRDGLFWPGALAFDGSFLWVGEFKFSGRLLRYAVSPQPEFSAQAKALLDRARAANPQRFQLALDQGARILPTADGRSFYLLWTPPGAPQSNPPLIVTLHGSASWAFDEFFLWREQAADYGYGILALQWWFGGDGPDAYYSPKDLHRETREALRGSGAGEGSALLHGFSRGSANIYGLAALDRQSGDRLYAMVLANAGGASVDFPPNVAITSGELGYNIFSGTYWTLFCGGRDPNPDRDGCPAMRRTAGWIGQFGGVVDLFIEDGAAGHGGFHQTPAHIRAALEAFRNLELRNGAVRPDKVWQVLRDPAFEIPGGSIPNAGFVGGEVRLTVGGPGGMRLYRSADGTNSTSPETLPGLETALSGTGYGAGEVIPREDRAGRPLLYVLGLAPPGANGAVLYRLAFSDGRYSREPASPVFEGEAKFIGVPDITPARDGRLRLTYVARGTARSNSRTAVSADDGASFTSEFDNPFGDLAVPNPRATDTNVDPTVVRLSRGGYLAVTMRDKRLYLFTSIDGRTFTPSPQPPLEAATLAPGADGLFDPTLVQLPDGRIFLYATAGTGPSGRIVRAEIR